MLNTLSTWIDPPWWAIALLALVAVGALVRALRIVVRRHQPATPEALSGSHLVFTVVIALAALALITFAFAMSYATLYEAATWLEHTPLGDLRWMFPIGIDAVIVYFLALDLVMEWQGRRHPLARYSAYTLSGLTVVLNVAQSGQGAGLGEYLGHAGPPVVIIAISEGVAVWIRYLAGLANGDIPDRIPAGRWIAHPLSTLKVARLMLGWGITSYEQALKLERRRQFAYAMLRQQYGRTWRRRTPRHVRWMLDNGHNIDATVALVRALAADVALFPEEVPGATRGSTGNSRGDDTSSVESALSERLDRNGERSPRSLSDDCVAETIADIERFLAQDDQPGGPESEHPERAPLDPEGEHQDTPDGDTKGQGERRAHGSARNRGGRSTKRSGTPARRSAKRGAHSAIPDNTERVRRALEETPEASTKDLAERLGIGRSTVRRIRAKLRRHDAT